MMRPADVVRRGAGYLDRHDVESPFATAEVLMMKVLGAGRTDLYARTTGLSTAEAKAFGRLLCRRCTGVPAQHLTGTQGFRRLVLAVRPGVFVPRPETEVLVEVAVATFDGDAAPLVVDVGTGAGAVALAVKDECAGAQVWATDRSTDAVALARANADALGIAITVAEGNLLDPLPEDLRGKIDLVVANPPYVEPSDEPQLPPEVRADPRDSVVGGFEVYPPLFAQAAVWLRPGGSIAVEIGDRQSGAVSEAAAAAGFQQISVHRDLNGRERVVAAERP
jgi:release factor glutamine methyltransferase